MFFKVSSEVFSPIYKSLFVSYTADTFCIRIPSSFYYFWDEESERKISLSFWITFACRLIWSTYLILLFFNKYFLSFLTFSPVFEKYICYLLTLCSRRKQSEAFFSFTWKTWKTWLYQVWSQCSHHVETIYLICMTNRINGVLYDYKAACKCLN